MAPALSMHGTFEPQTTVLQKFKISLAENIQTLIWVSEISRQTFHMVTPFRPADQSIMRRTPIA